jgi:hypothetical protein
MLTQAGDPPAQAAPPAAPATPTAPVEGTIVIQGAPGLPAQTISIPLSLGDVRWLRARRAELTEQLTDAKDRREGITDELVGATRVNQAGLEQQLAQVDQRIVQLESELARTEQILTSAPSGFLAAVEPPDRGQTGDPEATVVVPSLLILFVAFPLVIAFTRRLWKGTPVARVSAADNGRLERIEQAVEAIAVEVERVSEGQRFVTKLLSEADRKPLSLPADR